MADGYIALGYIARYTWLYGLSSIEPSTPGYIARYSWLYSHELYKPLNSLLYLTPNWRDMTKYTCHQRTSIYSSLRFTVRDVRGPAGSHAIRQEKQRSRQIGDQDSYLGQYRRPLEMLDQETRSMAPGETGALVARLQSYGELLCLVAGACRPPSVPFLFRTSGISQPSRIGLGLGRLFQRPPILMQL